MDKQEQIRVINELADSLLIVLEEIDSLKLNISRINNKLEIDTRVSHQSPENIFSILSNSREKKQFSKYLRENFLDVKNHQTALYESIKDLDIFLANKFSPKNIINEFTDLGKLNNWSHKQKDAQIWKEYTLKYSYLNENRNGESSLIKGFLIERYRAVIEMFRLLK